MKIRVIDFETTGIPTDDTPHAICEFAFVDVIGEGKAWNISVMGSALVDPGRPIPPEASAVHHITDAHIAQGGTPDENGKPTRAGPPDLACARLMQDPPDYFCAHNADFERAFFRGGDVPWICTYKAALRVWPDAPAHSNQVLRYWLGLDVDGKLAMPPHRALPDAIVTAYILISLLEAGTAIPDMQKWSRGHALLPKVTFGKHRGSKWCDLPIDYLLWIRDKSDMDAGVKANAKYWLKQHEERV